MGTSSSSKGPKGGVSFDPPWLTSATGEIGITPSTGVLPVPIGTEIAPSNRFTSARINFRNYATGNGGRNSLKKAVRAYVRYGLGGSARAAARMRYTTAIGSRLYSLLRGADVADGGEFQETLRKLLEGEHSVEDVISEIVNFVVKAKGGADEELARASVTEALSEKLSQDPDIDLLNMDEDALWELLAIYMEKEIVKRMYFDIGQSLESDAINIATKLSKLEDVEKFVGSAVTVRLERTRKGQQIVSQQTVCDIIAETEVLTFKFFEGGM